MKRCLTVVFLCAFIIPCLYSDSPPPRYELKSMLAELDAAFNLRISEWKVFEGDSPESIAPDYDHRAWQTGGIGYRWDKPNSSCWFRHRLVMPDRLGGLSVKGTEVRLKLGIDNGGKVYVNGEYLGEFTRSDGDFIISENARPGEEYVIVIEGLNRPGWGSLLDARLESSSSKALVKKAMPLLENIRFGLDMEFDRDRSKKARRAAKVCLDMLLENALREGDAKGIEKSIEEARKVFEKEFVDVIREEGRELLRETKEETGRLEASIAQMASDGGDPSYPRSTLTLSRQFQELAAKDLRSSEIRLAARGRWNADYIRDAVRRATREARTLCCDDVRAQVVPRYRTGPVAIRDGALWQGDQPLFLLGFGHFDQVRKDLSIFQDYGFNAAQLTLSVGSVLRSPEKDDHAYLDGLLAALDTAAEYNIALDVLLEVHGWPDWTFDEYPGLKCDDNHGFIKYKIDHPAARELLERFFAAIIPKLAEHPALFSYCLTNEPAYYDESEFSRQQFVKRLQSKHGTLEKLSNAWQMPVSSWDSISIPSGPEQVGPFSDWMTFNRDRLSEFHEFLAASVKKYDADTPVHCKQMAKLFDTSANILDSADPERLTRVGRLSGNDNWSYYRTWTEQDWHTDSYSVNWWRRSMFYDLQKSVMPGNPIFNSENHIIEDDTPKWVSPQHIRSHYWLDAIHGLAATTTWVWEHNTSPTVGDSMLTRPQCVEAAGRINLDMNRLATYVHKFPKIPSKVRLLFSQASIAGDEAYLTAMKKAYEGLYFLGHPIRFITDRQLSANVPADDLILIAPNTRRIEEAVYENTLRWVRAGGWLVASEDAFSTDEYGRPRDRSPLIAPNNSGLRNVGKGKVWYLPANNTGTDYRVLLNDLLDAVNAARPLRVTDELGQPISGIHHLSYVENDRIIAHLINVADDERTIRLNTPGKITGVTDLFDNTPQETLIELPPLTPLLLEIGTRH